MAFVVGAENEIAPAVVGLNRAFSAIITTVIVGPVVSNETQNHGKRNIPDEKRRSYSLSRQQIQKRSRVLVRAVVKGPISSALTAINISTRIDTHKAILLVVHE